MLRQKMETYILISDLSSINNSTSNSNSGSNSTSNNSSSSKCNRSHTIGTGSNSSSSSSFSDGKTVHHSFLRPSAGLEQAEETD